MTVSSTTFPAIEYVGNGSTTVFPYPFRILTASDLQVTVNGVAVTTGYSVTGVNEPAGGTVVFAVAPAASAALVLRRATPATQLLNLVDHDPEPAETIEQAHDKAVLLIQDVHERLSRTLSLEPTDGVAFPDPDDPANQDKAVFVNGSGEFEMRTVSTTAIASPITAKGDLIQGANDGTPEKLAIGAANQVLTVVGGKAAWSGLAGIGSIPLTLIDAKGDLIAGTAADTADRLAVGATGTVLTADAAQPTGLRWSLPGSSAVALLLEAATLPDGSGSGNAPPQLVREVSTGVQTANTPKATRTYAKFNDATDQHLLWGILLPNNYGSGGTIRLKWKSLTATAGVAVWKAGVGVSTDGVTADSTVVFNAADLVTSTVPGTVTQLVEATITLTMTGAAATRWMTVFLGRWASHASDTLVGDAVLVGARLEYVPA